MTNLGTSQDLGQVGERLVIDWIEDQNLAWTYGKDLLNLGRRLTELPHNDLLHRVTEIRRRKIREFCGPQHGRILDLVKEYKDATLPEMNQRGFPDFMVKANGLTFIEVKTNTASLLPSQRHFLSLARRHAFECFLARIKLGAHKATLSIELFKSSDSENDSKRR